MKPDDRDGLPTLSKPKSRSQIWKENNRERYNDYQREYMRKYRARRREQEAS